MLLNLLFVVYIVVFVVYIVVVVVYIVVVVTVKFEGQMCSTTCHLVYEAKTF